MQAVFKCNRDFEVKDICKGEAKTESKLILLSCLFGQFWERGIGIRMFKALRHKKLASVSFYHT